MSSPKDPRRRAATDRDWAIRRLRRSTQVSVVVTLALGGAFAGLAAASTHPKKVVLRTPVRRATTTAKALTVAPAPPLVAVQGAEQPSASAATPTPPAAAPAPSYQPPVVASGGS
jgi:hypothetical protein